MNGVVDSDLGVSAILWMFGGAAAGLLLAPLAGWLWRAPGRDGFPMGLCVFMLVFGVAASTGALRLAHAAWQFHRASQEAPGVLVEFVAKSYYDSKKRRQVQTRHPRVEFTAADGSRHSLVGLGGSLSQRPIGSAVTVRYRADQPTAAAVADFQSQWGSAWAFGLFGGAALLVALGTARGLVADPVGLKSPGAATRRSWGFWLMLVCAGLYAVHVGLGAWALTRP